MAQDIQGVEDVLRARRFELVDRDGRVRAVLGPERHSDSGVGLSILNPEGEHRVSLGMTEDGAWLLFELGGNAVIWLGTYEPGGDAVDTLAYFILCDASGLPVAGWRITDSGEVVVEPPMTGPPLSEDSADKGATAE